MCMSARLLQSCLTFCDPTDCSPLGSSVHGILQAKILEYSPSPGNLLTQGLNLNLSCLLFWQAGSLPLAPPGNLPYSTGHSK